MENRNSRLIAKINKYFPLLVDLSRIMNAFICVINEIFVF